jgi:signal transduction histidine kinase
MKIERSLLSRIIFGQLLVVTLFCVLATGNLLWQFYKQGEGELDQQFVMGVKTFLRVLEPEKNDPAALRKTLALLDRASQSAVVEGFAGKSSARDGIQTMLRVTDESGNELYSTTSPAKSALQSLPVGFSQFESGGRVWRALTAQNDDATLTIQLAQTNNTAAHELIITITKFIFWPLVWFLPFAAILTWLVAKRGLAPLHTLAQLIARRSPSDLKPIQGVKAYRETSPLIDEINALLSKLDTTLTRERNFLADAAHELRTPLAVVQAQVHVLKHATTEAEKNAASEELNVGIARAASLIRKLLLTARVSVDDFVPRFEVTNLTGFVQERVATLSPLAEAKQIEMELDAPPHCFAHIDRETLGSAIDNVLDNAIRYTPPQGKISVAIESLGGDRVRLRVADNGSGIPPESRDRVFERFYRVPGNEQPGSGLGLAIVKRVVALHGGAVALSTGLEERGLAVDLTVPVGA